MNATHDRVQRMLAMVPYLQANSGIAVRELADQFAVTEKQIRDDVLLLMMTGTSEFGGDLIDVDVASLDEHGVINLRDAEFMSRPLRISSHEGAAVVVALRTLRAWAGAGHADIIDSALAKIEAALGDTLNTPVDVVAEPIDSDLRDTVSSALADGKRIALTYAAAASDVRTDRLVDPRRIFTERGQLYLEAWCMRADDLRFFRFDRIVSATITDEDIADHDTPAQSSESGVFSVQSDTPSVHVRLHPEALWIGEYYPVEILGQDDTGVYSAKLFGADPGWLHRLLLRNAGHVTAIDSEPLASEVIDSAKAALAAYDGIVSDN